MAWGGRCMLVVAATVLGLAHPAAADWLQEGGDAARTGTVQGNLPAWPDVALTVRLNHSGPPVTGVPVILGRTAYVAVPGAYVASPTVGTGYPPSRIVGINLDTGQTEDVLVADWPLTHLASDGHSLVAVGRGRAAILAPGDPEVAWVDLDESSTNAGDVAVRSAGQRAGLWGSDLCGEPAVTGTVAFVGCLGTSSGYPMAAVAAISLESRTRLWWASLDKSAVPYGLQGPCTPPDPCWSHTMYPAGEAAVAFPPRLSVVGEHVYAAVNSLQGDAELGYHAWTLYRLDAGTGEVYAPVEGTFDIANPSDYSGSPMSIPAPTGAGDVYTKNYFVRRYDGVASRNASFQEVAFRDYTEGDLGSGIAFLPDRLVVPSLRRLVAFDHDLGVLDEFRPLDLPSSEVWDAGPILHGGPTLLGRAALVGGRLVPSDTILYAVDARSGKPVWRHDVEGLARIAASDGVIVAAKQDGIVQVLGTTAASLQPRLETATQYPGTEDLVEVDLSATVPGLGGPATEFAADWGDGSTTLWQRNARLTHRYAADGDMQARFLVRNAANQTASAPLTFFVGRADPAVTFWNSPFSDRYQNTSFFLLGLLATALAGAVGVARAGRKRRRFQRELRELEQDYERLQPRPRACDGMLSRRKSGARALFLEKRIEEAHASFLERRVDELRRGLRLGTVEDELKFLPYGMVLHLQRLLADAHVDRWERDHFLDALARAPDLSAAQRAKARRVVEAWLARDADA